MFGHYIQSIILTAYWPLYLDSLIRYTYRLKHEKAYKVVMRGMHPENVKSIKDELEKVGH